jgi:virulence factor Mce-like protein
MRRVAAAGAIAAVALAIAAIVAGGSSPYVVRVRLADAVGLRQNSPVMIGGVQAGTVTLRLGRRDQVIAELEIDRAQAPVGRNASVAIAAVNFLGQKEAELTRGNVADPAPSGYVIPASRVTISTDLDQVLDVLDASTRARLAILIDEAGTAVTGRRADLSSILAQLPPSLQSADVVLSRLVSDNHTLAHLLATSDQFVTQTDARRAQLVRLVDRVGQAAATVASRRQSLATTLARAPGTLAELQSFLARLKATAAPLGPAAEDLVSTAPVASAALAQLGPFVTAATPALHTATALAPQLTELGVQATPVLAQANPTVASLATFSGALQPVSTILNRSVDNVLAVVENWSRAIQFRDGLSHVFRGEASITPNVLESLVNRLLGGASARRRRPVSHPRPAVPGTTTPAPTRTLPAPTLPIKPHLPISVGGVLSGVTGAVHKLRGATQQPPSGATLSSLLHYLLGR